MEERDVLGSGHGPSHINVVNNLLKIGIMRETEKVIKPTMIVKEFNFGIILEKVTALEDTVGGFNDKKFKELVEGCKEINQKLIFLKNLEDEVLEYA